MDFRIRGLRLIVFHSSVGALRRVESPLVIPNPRHSHCVICILVTSPIWQLVHPRRLLNDFRCPHIVRRLQSWILRANTVVLFLTFLCTQIRKMNGHVSLHCELGSLLGGSMRFDRTKSPACSQISEWKAAFRRLFSKDLTRFRSWSRVWAMICQGKFIKKLLVLWILKKLARRNEKLNVSGETLEKRS